MPAFILSQEENQLIKEVRELANGKIKERGTYLDKIGDDKIDWQIPEVLAKHNLLAPNIPAEYGGRGLSMLATAHVIEELAFGCAGAAAIVVMNIYSLTPVLVTGSEAMKNEILPKFCSDRPHLGCTAISETTPEHDLEPSQRLRADETRITTTAALEGDWITINGTKDFIMNGAAADFVVVLARSKESKRKSRIQMYLVPRKTPGLEVVRVLNKVGMRSCHTVQLRFNDVVIPADNRIGIAGGGYFLLTQTFDRNLPLIGAAGIGIARAAYELAMEVARTNRMLNRDALLKKYVSSALVEMSTEIDAARLAVERAAYYIDTDDNFARAAYMAKLYATRTAQRVAFQTVDIIGRMGFAVSYNAEKYLRDAQMLSMIAGSEYLHKTVLAGQL
ncbi:Acyl-CoA dehydrogenase/oxidase C-terminal [Syntrophomonas zehnderi OL-4]|uniref:Acyl-CoA dehydrogenase/oxidase C-terminal n=1 Tax=Syntrophomonas zehnderi OL-4 TaxID=690567 RepID=A0A0E3W3Q9_9FIRM|nr:acyl-CoA dehydrogenase family protein [Syntrophomonas zehnderi]CFX99212.1 Acyl-CoA dehydrogenase/oxidase C-terminal [Syntrophomonas zehnderi OL-4]